MVKRRHVSPETENRKRSKTGVKSAWIEDIPQRTPTYLVIRREVDNHNSYGGVASESTEIRGTYPTLKEANCAAKDDLLKQWSRDFFTSYRTRMVQRKFVRVKATCPEGEVMSVHVEKHDMKMANKPVYLVMKAASPSDIATVDSAHTHLASAKLALEQFADGFASSNGGGEGKKSYEILEGNDDKPFTVRYNGTISKTVQQWDLAFVIRQQTSNLVEEEFTQEDPGTDVDEKGDDEDDENGDDDEDDWSENSEDVCG